jgi:MFS family permease
VSRPYRVLRHPEFRRLWAAQLLSITGSQMQSTAAHWHVYLLTGSPVALGGLGLSRVLPIILFSLFGGVVADRFDRGKVMLATQALMAVCVALLAGLTLAGRDNVMLIYATYLLLGAAQAFDGPARQSLIPRLVPTRELPAAITLNLTAMQAAQIGGPALAGLWIAAMGAQPPAALGHLSESARELGWIYAANAVSYLAVVFALARLRTSVAPIRREAGESMTEAVRDGLRFVFRTPLLVWTMGLDFVATFFSGALSLLPIVADRLLGVGAAGYGWLAAAPAAGALVGSLATTVFPLPRRQGRVLLYSVAGYGLATVVYGLSRSYALTFLALALSGLADLVSTVIRQTLRQLVTPDALRGRMISVSAIFFMGGPQLGEMEAGLLAGLFASQVFGVTLSVVSGGLMTMLAAAWVALRARVVRDYSEPRPSSSDEVSSLPAS